MSENNSEKGEKPQQEEQDYNRNEIKDPQEDEQKENLEAMPEENKKIFIKNIPFNTTDDQLRDFFSRFGNVVKAETMKRENGTSSGVGLVEFGNVEEKKSVLSMNRDDLVIDGRRLEVREAKPDRMDYSKTLYVGNISYNTSEETLKKFFVDFCQNLKGDFKVSIQTNFNGRPKGHAYIEFENEEDLSNALKANGQKLDERMLTVEMKKPRGVGGPRNRGRPRFQGGMGRREGFGNRRYDHGKDHGRDRVNFYRDRSKGRSRSRDRERSRERDRDRRRDRGERDRGDRDRGDRDRYKGDRNDRDRGDRDRGRVDRDRGDRERVDRDRGDRGNRDRGDRDRGDRDRSRERRHIHHMDRDQA